MSWLNQPYGGQYGQPGFPQGLAPQATGYPGPPQMLQVGDDDPAVTDPAHLSRAGPAYRIPASVAVLGKLLRSSSTCRADPKRAQLPTGYGGQLRPQLPLQGQPTGFAPMQQRPMATGYPGQPQQFQAQPPPFQSQPSYQQAPPPAFGQGLQSQFISTFLPAQNVQPQAFMNPSQMQFASPTGPSLQQSFQQNNQATVRAPPPPRSCADPS